MTKNILVDYMSDKDMKMASLYSLAVIGIVNGMGMYCFKRKDLKQSDSKIV